MARRTAAKSSPRRRPGRVKAKKATHSAHTKLAPNLLILPLDILSIVFEIICQGSSGDTDASGTLADHQSRHEATNFLLTCRHLYDHFGPLYWRKRTIVFTDPVRLANEFLAFASDTATVNLRSLYYIVSIGTFDTTMDSCTHIDTEKRGLLVSREVRKLCEVIGLYYSELKNLKSLTVELILDYWLSIKILEAIGDADGESRLSANKCWEVVDRICKGCFGQLEKTVRRTLLKHCKDFHIAAAVDSSRCSALVRNSLLDLGFEIRAFCNKLTLTFGRDD